MFRKFMRYLAAVLCCFPTVAIAELGNRVTATERDHELVASLASKRPRLRGAKVMGVCGLTAADETRLLGHKTQVGFIALAVWRRRRRQ